MLYQIVSSLEAALPGGEGFAAGTANDGATLKRTESGKKEEAQITNLLLGRQIHSWAHMPKHDRTGLWKAQSFQGKSI